MNPIEDEDEKEEEDDLKYGSWRALTSWSAICFGPT